MSAPKLKFRTMYMHTLDGAPAYVYRWTRGRVTMLKVTRHQRVPLYESLHDLRVEWNEVAGDAGRVSRRDYPFSPRELHAKAAMDLLNRISYRLVAVPLGSSRTGGQRT